MAQSELPEFLREMSRDRPAATRNNDSQQGAAGPQSPSPQDWTQERTRVAVGAGATISGKLFFSEPIRIEGHFKGEVISESLVVIEEHGQVDGRVHASRLVVMGELRGDVIGSARVSIGPRGRVYGDIDAVSFAMSEGAHFEGHVRMDRDGASASNPEIVE